MLLRLPGLLAQETPCLNLLGTCLQLEVSCTVGQLGVGGMGSGFQLPRSPRVSP